MASGKTDYIGCKYGRLTVTGKSKNSRGLTVYDCLCDCGNRKNNVCIADLKRGHTSSCGCYNREKIVERNKKYIRKTHGKSKTPEYRSWHSMMQRCYSQKHEAHSRYGGKGIIVCERWHDFENFLSDMGLRPLGTTLDRIDNSAGYTPDNCRWSNPVVQTRNRSNTITVEFQGEIRVLADLAEEYGISAARLRSRVKELGWSIDKALTVKDGRRRANA